MLVIRPQAENEITETALWYEAQHPGLGSDFLKAVHAAAGRAREAPAQYPRVHGNVRRVLLQRFPYMLIFSWPEFPNWAAVVAFLTAEVPGPAFHPQHLAESRTVELR